MSGITVPFQYKKMVIVIIKTPIKQPSHGTNENSSRSVETGMNEMVLTQP